MDTALFLSSPNEEWQDRQRWSLKKPQNIPRLIRMGFSAARSQKKIQGRTTACNTATNSLVFAIPKKKSSHLDVLALTDPTSNRHHQISSLKWRSSDATDDSKSPVLRESSAFNPHKSVNPHKSSVKSHKLPMKSP